MVTPIDNDGRKIRGYAIISKGDTPERISGSTYRIPSQSGKGVYIVTIKPKRSECNCIDWKNRQLDCKHIHAIKLWREIRGQLKNETMPQLKEEKQACPFCKAEKLIKRGIRKNKNVEKQRYSCNNCKKRFVIDIGLGTKVNGQIITLCLDLYFKGISLRKIQDHLKQFYKIEISHMTIKRWIKKFMALANRYANSQNPKVSGMWHADEQMIKNNGGYLWIWNCMDANTRFLLANNITQSRYLEDAQQIFEKSKQIGGRPDIIVTDGLPAYPKAIDKSFIGMTTHIKADGITSKKKNNNMIERFHNTFRERDKVMRGFKGQTNAEFMATSFQTYYNFIRPHMSLGGLTPSQVAGIPQIEGNRWMGLLKSKNT